MPFSQDPPQSLSPEPETQSHANLEPEPRLTKSQTNPYATASSTETRHTTSQISQHHSRYELGEEIARGGMGAIYRAYDTTLGREVAIKMLLDKFGPQSNTARRFADEARIAGQLQHPGIPPVHDLGIFPDGRSFMAMKLIKGDTLDVLLKSRANPSSEHGRFIAVFEQVCHAIAYAHAHDVIHRDLKPSNIMVGNYGEVQVMDWGLAKVIGIRTSSEADAHETAPSTLVQSLRDSDGSFTQAGSVLGTPAYMPPEQAVGAIGKIDRRSDVFGLGAILAVILTGHPPFDGNTAETTRVKAAQGDVLDCFARLDNTEADVEIVSLCKRCLSPKPADRPANASEVAQAVATLRAVAEERARKAELDRIRLEGEKAASEVRVSEQIKRRRVQIAFAVVACAFLLAMTGVASWRINAEQLAKERHRRNEEAVSTLLDQCTEALQKNDPEKATVALKAADSRAQEGENDSLRTRRELLKSDLALIRDLDETDILSWTPVDGVFPGEMQNANRFLTVLIQHGVDPDESRREHAMQTISQSNIRDRIISVCDLVLRVKRLPEMRSLLQSADKDPFRDIARNAVMTMDKNAIHELMTQPGVESQPARFLVQLGQYPTLPQEKKRELLTLALSQNPADLWALMAMSRTYPFDEKEGSAEKIRWLQAALTVSPKNTGILNELGIALLKFGNIDGSIQAHMAALNQDPDNENNIINLARSLNNNGMRHLAIDQLHHAISLYPQSAIAWNNLGVVLDDCEDFDGAIAAYRKVIELDPKYISAHYNLGFSLKTKGDIEGAINAYRNVIKLDPQRFNALNNLGLIMNEMGDGDGSIAIFREAIKHDAKYIPAHFNLGDSLKAKGDLDGAISEYREVINLDPQHVKAHFNLGSTLEDKNDINGAIAEYRETIKLNPRHFKAHFNLGSILDDKKDWDGAIAEYQEAIKLEPLFANAYLNLGVSLKAKGDFNGAIAAYRKAINIDPKLVKAHYNIGIILKAKEDFEGAIAAYREAIHIDPLYTNAHFNLGGVLLDHMNDYDGAITAFHDAIKLNPKDASAHLNLAISLKSKGDFDGAIAACREVLKLNPKHVKGMIILGDSLEAKGDLNRATAAYQDALGLDSNHTGALAKLKNVEQIRELLPQLPDVLSGKTEPQSSTELCEYASLCAKPHVKKYVAAVKLYQKAFETNTHLKENNQSILSQRYNAASYAARACRGEGVDAPSDEKMRASLRNQALIWLNAELANVQKQANSPYPYERKAASNELRSWLIDPDFSELRNVNQRTKFSENERKQWELFWSEVNGTLDKAKQQPELLPSQRAKE